MQLYLLGNHLLYMSHSTNRSQYILGWRLCWCRWWCDSNGNDSRQQYHRASFETSWQDSNSLPWNMALVKLINWVQFLTNFVDSINIDFASARILPVESICHSFRISFRLKINLFYFIYSFIRRLIWKYTEIFICSWILSQ